MANGTNGTTKITAEEIFNALIFFLIKNPKKALITLVTIALFVFGGIYLTFMKAQNDMMMEAMSAFKDVMQMEKTITDLKKRADASQVDLEERIKRLDAAEKSFQEKRESIQNLRKQQDELLKEIQAKLIETDKKLDTIENKALQTQTVLKEVEQIQQEQKRIVDSPLQLRLLPPDKMMFK